MSEWLRRLLVLSRGGLLALHSPSPKIRSSFNWKRAKPVKSSLRNGVAMETSNSVKAASREPLRKWGKMTSVSSGFLERFLPRLGEPQVCPC